MKIAFISEDTWIAYSLQNLFKRKIQKELSSTQEENLENIEIKI